MLGRLFQSFGAKLEKDLPPAVNLDILGFINWLLVSQFSFVV